MDYHNNRKEHPSSRGSNSFNRHAESSPAATYKRSTEHYSPHYHHNSGQRGHTSRNFQQHQQYSSSPRNFSGGHAGQTASSPRDSSGYKRPHSSALRDAETQKAKRHCPPDNRSTGILPRINRTGALSSQGKYSNDGSAPSRAPALDVPTDPDHFLISSIKIPEPSSEDLQVILDIIYIFVGFLR